jgi:predicted AAA+ superfamily ATPase
MFERSAYSEKMKAFKNSPLIKVLCGIRRAGKSSILLMHKDSLINSGVPSEKISHISFENLEYLDIKNERQFAKLVKGILNKKGNGNKKSRHRHYFLFDEIQNVDKWERVINGLLANGNVDIYLTGSNSKLLSSELSTHIAGRFVKIFVSTLSFSEALFFKKERGVKLKNTSDEFDDYLKKGGFPIIHAGDYSLEQIDNIVSDIYSSIVLKDIIERYKIRNTELLNRVVKFIFDNIGNIFSAKSVSDYLKNEKRKLDIETIYFYMSMLESVFAIRKAERYDVRGKSILKTQEKYYLGDHSLLFAVNGRKLSHISGILENIVYNELIRKGYDVYIGKNGDKEIDFVAKKSNKTLYLQVATHLDSKSTIDREFGVFKGISDNHPKIVLSLDKGFSENQNGIEQKFLPDFLLELS